MKVLFALLIFTVVAFSDGSWLRSKYRDSYQPRRLRDDYQIPRYRDSYQQLPRSLIRKRYAPPTGCNQWAYSSYYCKEAGCKWVEAKDGDLGPCIDKDDGEKVEVSCEGKSSYWCPMTKGCKYMKGEGCVDENFQKPEEVPSTIEKKGCYKAKTDLRIKKLGGLTYDWDKPETSIDDCAELAKSEKQEYFAIYWLNECWAVGNDYAKYGKKTNCKDGNGGVLSYSVYHIKKL